MKTIEIDDRLFDFINESVRLYRGFTETEQQAQALFLDVVFGEYITRRLACLISEQELNALLESPEKLYEFATDYLKKRPVEFDEGEKLDLNWDNKNA